MYTTVWFSIFTKSSQTGLLYIFHAMGHTSHLIVFGDLALLRICVNICVIHPGLYGDIHSDFSPSGRSSACQH